MVKIKNILAVLFIFCANMGFAFEQDRPLPDYYSTLFGLLVEATNKFLNDAYIEACVEYVKKNNPDLSIDTLRVLLDKITTHMTGDFTLLPDDWKALEEFLGGADILEKVRDYADSQDKVVKLKEKFSSLTESYVPSFDRVAVVL